MIERRSHPRVKVSHPALFLSDMVPRPRVATTVDLSMGGTRIETPYNLIFGEGLQISIAIHPQTIKCKGRVVHISPVWGERQKTGARFEAGVQFEAMSKHDRLYLGQYISHVMEQRN
jgi:hypothetical protein